MKVMILFVLLFFVSGCGWVANPRSKLASEAKKQTLILERIAVALESNGCFVDRGGVCRERR